jgi:hypothetical protein
MSPNKWGPPTWNFFHCLAENIKEEDFQHIGVSCFNLIQLICKNLPCPDCSNHATQILSNIKFEHIKNKENFINLIYIFHNMVNKKKQKPMFNVLDLNKYKNKNLIQSYNEFIKVYQTKGNMKLLADSFARSNTIQLVKKYLIKNINHFHNNK